MKVNSNTKATAALLRKIKKRKVSSEEEEAANNLFALKKREVAATRIRRLDPRMPPGSGRRRSRRNMTRRSK